MSCITVFFIAFRNIRRFPSTSNELATLIVCPSCAVITSLREFSWPLHLTVFSHALAYLPVAIGVLPCIYRLLQYRFLLLPCSFVCNISCSVSLLSQNFALVCNLPLVRDRCLNGMVVTSCSPTIMKYYTFSSYLFGS